MMQRPSANLWLTCLVVGLFSACLHPAQDPVPRQIPLTVLFTSTQCNDASTGFKAVWFSRPGQLTPLAENTIGADRAAAPTWDPRTEGALLLHMGTRRTGGFHIELEKTTATLEHGMAAISIHLQAPGSGMFTTQAITSPCLLVALPKSGVRQIEVRDRKGQVLYRKPGCVITWAGVFAGDHCRIW